MSLQRVRKAVDNLRELGNTEHLSKYQLVVAGKSIVLVEPGQEAGVDLVKSSGAQRPTITLGDVFASFENQRGDRVVDLFHPRKLVTVDPEIRGGYPVVEGTRVDYDLVASLVRDGVDPSDVSDFYPSVSTQGAAAVASVIVAMPQVATELEAADGQRPVRIEGINPVKRRHTTIDPKLNPPAYWT